MAGSWRDAASLILASGKKPIKALLLQRKSRGTYAKMQVFPGGAVDPSDLSPKWMNHFHRYKIPVQHLCLPKSATRPPILNTRPGELDREVALRITAIRETFEECGILLAAPKEKVLKPEPVLSKWRRKVLENGENFREMCEELAIVPDVFALRLWSNWLTSADYHPRFDVLFFIAEGDASVKVEVAEDELRDAQWLSSQEALESMEQPEKNLLIPGPQMYEFSRMSQFDKASDLLKFAEERERFGVEQWLYVRMFCKDGSIGLLPGDDACPKKPDYNGTFPVLRSDETMAELRQRTANLHRIEATFDECVTGIFCNISTDAKKTLFPVNVRCGDRTGQKKATKMAQEVPE